MKSLYHFGPFALDPNRRALFRQGKPVPLTPKAFDVLLYLAQNPNRVIPKEELLNGVWAGSFVEEGNLSQNVFLLRKALAEEGGESGLIVTVPRMGYQFAAEVATVDDNPLAPAGGAADKLVLAGVQSTTHIVYEEEIVPDPKTEVLGVGGAKALPGTVAGVKLRWYFLALVLATVATAVALRPVVPPPKVTRIRQITHLGSLVHNTKLLTDGPRIYFRVWDGKDRAIRYVSPEGGGVFPVEMAFPRMDIDDLSPSGSEFLVVNLGDKGGVPNSENLYPSVWRVPVPSGSPRPVGDVRARDVAWSPDGRTIAFSVGSALYLVNPDGSDARKLASLPSDPFYLRWSPDGRRLCFSVADPRRNDVALWQADLTNNTVQPLLPDWPNSGRVLPGGWTPDGRYFFFTAFSDGTRNVWAIREKQETLRRTSSQPVQITAGPLTFYLPVPSKDGKSIFALGEQLRGQLVRYDDATRQFVPYADGISADHITFSRDGKWMAYVEFPEGVLVRCRADGSEKRQLTFSPMRVFSPQWSPDGTQIAFQASAQMGAHNKIYVVSSSGGVPVLAAPESQDRQAYPSWASDGSSILFSSSDETDSNPVLRSLDVRTKRVSFLPGSKGLYWGQLSPDGRHIIALEQPTQRLMLYDMVAHNTRALAELADYPRWSDDGQYVYFSTPYFHPRGVTGGVYRWKVSTEATEVVTRYPEFLLAGIWGVCYGLTPNGSTLMLRDVSTRDLYALDSDLP
jgi:DNA-binding winged helix-turn-helix (wHTH) protein/Tol biopolymer transport system component